jgi:hypothetical protein
VRHRGIACGEGEPRERMLHAHLALLARERDIDEAMCPTTFTCMHPCNIGPRESSQRISVGTAVVAVVIHLHCQLSYHPSDAFR